MTTITKRHPANFTRRTLDLAGKLRRERRYGFLALYHLLRLSDLGREGIERSGSFRFADHLYANRASGRGLLGLALDRLLLSLPASRAMRQRCVESTAAMHRALAAHRSSAVAETFRLMTVPCGLPRDVGLFADSIVTQGEPVNQPVQFTGLDLDPEVIGAARDFLAHYAVHQPKWVEGDALDPTNFPAGEFHFIASTGLGEFLDDTGLEQLYANVHRGLAPGGVFFTSATARERGSDALLRAFELRTHYRDQSQIEALMARLPWREVRFTHDLTGLQTFVYAVKG